MDRLEDVLKIISHFIWGNYLIALLIGVGIYFTFITKCIQVRGFSIAIKKIFNSNKESEKCANGTLTPIQALCLALSSCIGNGNIVGVATAIASGGPGAVFWMWLSGVLGMATKYSEILIGMIYREKNEEGTFLGGPMYYISKGLKWKKISLIFSVLMLLQISGGVLIQSNAVSAVAKQLFNISPLTTGITMSLIVLIVVSGGIKRLGYISEKLVTVMSIIYITGGLIVITINFHNFFDSLLLIIKSAFNFESIGGGVLGYSIKEAMRFGLARGLYSNEAGEGSAPVIHSTAMSDHPTNQAFLGIVEVFFDTMIICSLTSFVIITSGVYLTEISPALYIMTAFSSVNPSFKYIIGISMMLFAFSTILSQWYFGTVSLTYIFDSKFAKNFKYPFIFLAIIGAMSSLNAVWYIQDIVLGLMIIPNLIGIVALSGDVKKYTDDFFRNKLYNK